ncbi:glycosyltransferase family 4 protein [Pantoea septica]|uniref:glycosyltransferase family 4 protein n=1 Tax=Pantoea septica TaxID=472695 RepID=UPI0023F0CA72|nr:glycosyltransferase family 4 protein [Pantoea septica]
MKKVIFFINSDWYFKLHWIDRALALKKEGYEVYLLMRFHNHELLKELENTGFICLESGIDERSLSFTNFSRSAWGIYKKIKLIGPDLIHCVTIKPIVIGGLISKYRNIPFIAGFVGLGRVFSGEKRRYNILGCLISFLYGYLFNRELTRLIFESESDKEILISRCGVDKNKCLVINGGGININNLNATNEKNNDIPVVLFASRLIYPKGLQDLIEIHQSLSEKGHEFILNIAGIHCPGDSEAIPVSVINEWSKIKNINYLGKRDDVYQLISSSNIVALPSTYNEGVPMILIEACALRRAVIAYDSGGISAIVKNNVNGFLIKKKDKAELEVKLYEMLKDDSLRKRMGEAGEKLVKDEFISDKIINATLSVYKEIIK